VIRLRDVGAIIPLEKMLFRLYDKHRRQHYSTSRYRLHSREIVAIRLGAHSSRFLAFLNARSVVARVTTICCPPQPTRKLASSIFQVSSSPIGVVARRGHGKARRGQKVQRGQNISDHAQLLTTLSFMHM